jgi:hypothetical protein
MRALVLTEHHFYTGVVMLNYASPHPCHALRVGHLWCVYDRDLISVVPRSGP